MSRSEEFHQATQPVEPFPLNRDDLDAVLRAELGHKRVGGKEARHPRSGRLVDVGKTSPRLITPKEGDPEATASPMGFGILERGTPQVRIQDAGHFGDPHQGMTALRPSETRPVKYVYRAMHEDEWAQAQKQGYIASDARGAISKQEGTNAALDPSTAASYLPRKGRSLIVKIRVHPAEKWFSISADGYLRTRERIPLERIVRTTGAFQYDDKDRLLHGGEL